MKRVLLLVSFALMSASAWASTVLWAGIAEAGWMYDTADAVVEENGMRTPVDQYFGADFENALIRVKVLPSNEFLDIYYGNGMFEDGELGVFAQVDGGGYKYAHYIEMRLPDTIDVSTALVVMELGLCDDNGDFIFVAYSDEVALLSLMAKHTFEVGSIAPPSVDDWRPTVFYVPSPEPNSLGLVLLGCVALMAKRRKP